jgi:shikimate dehydrogenase
MTDRYAVIGNPISHSKSPLIHSMFAAQTGQELSYEAIEAPLDGFAATIKRLRAEGYKGCNVTVPFKFEAFGLATRLTERAQAAQAANTLKFDGDTILGDNTDGAGLVHDIQHNLGASLKDKHVLLMGAGGAAYGVALPLLHAQAVLKIYNRTEQKAQALKRALLESIAQSRTPLISTTGAGVDVHTELNTVGAFDVIINATSAGLTDSEVALPNGIFAPHALAYDMMYGRDTPFMRFARAQGAQVADGLGMLVEQAAEAFLLWRGVRPDTAPVMAKLRAQQ